MLSQGEKQNYDVKIHLLNSSAEVIVLFIEKVLLISKPKQKMWPKSPPKLPFPRAKILSTKRGMGTRMRPSV